jgi:hypothetical protein
LVLTGFPDRASPKLKVEKTISAHILVTSDIIINMWIVPQPRPFRGKAFFAPGPPLFWSSPVCRLLFDLMPALFGFVYGPPDFQDVFPVLVF